MTQDIRESVVEPLEEAQRPLREAMEPLEDLKKDVERLSPIEGLPPDPTQVTQGCAFYPRCAHRCDKCKQYKYEPTQLSDTHAILCCNPVKEGAGA